MKDTLIIKKVKAKLVRPLRHELLLWWHPFERTMYPGDDDNTTSHFAVISQKQIVGITSMYLRKSEQFPHTQGWQLRGVATKKSFRSRGVGRLLLHACEQEISEQGESYIWCNARTQVLPFYRKAGYQRVGEEYLVEGIGPHFFMMKWFH